MHTEVEWPDRRSDVLNAIEVLASVPPSLNTDGQLPRWPSLTDAVHWLVDDTYWDVRDPSEYVGQVLRSEDEAAAIRRLVAAVMAVASRQSAAAADVAWYADQGWQEVRSSAATALEALQAPAS